MGNLKGRIGMCDEFIHPGLVEDHRLSRRSFGLMTALAASLPASALAQSDVVEKDVEVKTADGTCDAALFLPAGKGSWSAVLVWPDIMGLRPAFRDMGRRLAAQGHVVLVPNPFYRSAHAPVIGESFDFNNPEQRNRLFGYRSATYLVCQAQNDDMQQPQMKEDLKAAFVAAKRPATVEVYQANHGWCVKGGAVYNEAEAERAWTALTKLYQSNLV